jgi:hypothetical protein
VNVRKRKENGNAKSKGKRLVANRLKGQDDLTVLFY